MIFGCIFFINHIVSGWMLFTLGKIEAFFSFWNNSFFYSVQGLMISGRERNWTLRFSYRNNINFFTVWIFLREICSIDFDIFIRYEYKKCCVNPMKFFLNLLEMNEISTEIRKNGWRETLKQNSLDSKFQKNVNKITEKFEWIFI